ncbi:hypothetical protein [Planctobacterium marinum]|uniref:hypothetical protein n=1 Tax=Planctobacterium marinum TaxID=1631968 RepID=UPI001E3EABF3|nr:hypothetical protein [Planctobacterium marinum]MCC2604778.1 hypothetical protein [Planctobacterium marinum]
MRTLIMFGLTFCITNAIASEQKQESGFYQSQKFRTLVNNIQTKYDAMVTVQLRDDTTGNERFVEGEELFVTTQIGDYLFGEMFAKKNTSNVRFALSSFVEILDFPIEIQNKPFKAEGWYVAENNHFALSRADQDELWVTINEETYLVPDDAYELTEDEIYIDADTLSVWFEIKMSFDFIDLMVVLAPKQPLPIQRRLERQNRNLNRNQRSPLPVLPPKEDTGYTAISPQTLDALVSVSYNNDQVSTLYSLQGGRDLAYFHSNFFLSGTDNDPLTDARLVFSKESNQKDLLGPLNAARLEIGDITGTRVGGATTGAQSRGVAISNVASNALNDIDFTNLVGDIAQDWDVELYRNGILLDQRLRVQTGRYEFNDVPLIYGVNDFELVFYGPQGQVRTEQTQYIIEGNLLGSNEIQYDLSLEDVGSSFLNVGSNKSDSTINPGYRLGGKYSIGLSDSFSARVGHTNVFGGDSDPNTYSAGGSLTINNDFLLGSDLTYNDAGTANINVSARTNVYDQSANLNVQYSETGLETDNKVTQSDVRFTVAGPLWQGTSQQLTHSTRLNYRDEFDGDQLTSISSNLAYRLPGYSINTNLDYAQVTTAEEKIDSLQGGISAQTNFGDVFTRFLINYSLLDDPKLLSAGTQFSWNLTDNIKSRLNLDYDFDQSISRVRWQASLNRDSYSLATNLAWDNLSKFSMSVQTRFSFGYAGNGTGYFLSSKQLSSRGSLVVRVFHDENANGIYEEGEPLLEGVSVNAKQIYGKASTNETGVAVLAALSTARATDIQLDVSTLPDAFMIPAIPGISITPRPGFVDTFDFPVVYGSDIEGIVSIYADDDEESAAYATVELLNSDGDVIKQIDAEYDGYYLFSEVHPGDYTVRVSPTYAEDKNLVQSEVQTVTLDHEGDLVSGLDFGLARKHYETGYTMNLGRFNSLTMLKVFWQLRKKRLKSFIQDLTPFYRRDDKTNEYQLNVGFFELIDEPDNLCKLLTTADLNCQPIDLQVLQK